MRHALLPNSHAEASVVSLRHRYVLVVNSKTAGTTLKAIAAELEGERLATRTPSAGDERAQRAENWLRTPTLADLPEAWLRRVILDDSFFRFTTVRHPIRRCWSAWVDKVLCRNGDFVARFGGEPWFADTVTSPEELVEAFVAFVDALASSAGLLGADRHWASQHLVLQWGAFPYDFVGKTEEFDRVIARWEEATGLAIASVAQRIGRRNGRQLPVPGSRIPEATWRTLARLYAIDFDAFGYDPEQTECVEDSTWADAAAELLGTLHGSELESRERPQAWSRLRRASARSARKTSARLERT
jgi:sulfotransferase famil protein